ncbi:MAG: peptide chain release factor 2, partial [Bacteroidales bacterium]|nr:peptide chain release factor 2 [Bacteroidales bacterium]
MITADQLKDVLERVHALRGYLDIDARTIQLEEEELRSQSPDFWNDSKAAEEKMKVIKSLKSWINGYDEVKNLSDELELAFEFVKDEIITEEEVDKLYARTIRKLDDLELKNMLRQEEDQLGAVLKVNAGAGGTESQDWAAMLVRMYQRWCENHDYKVTVTNWQDGDDAGIKTVTMQVEGDLAYGFLKSENGVHRLVRVSPFNAQGKRMTSFASVFIVPLVDDSIEINVDLSSITWDTFRSSGAGGQHVNKVESGVRLHYTHVDEDTGEEQEIAIENTEGRSQQNNRENAIRLLKSQLYEIELEKRRRAQAVIESGKKKIEWGSQIRSYVFDDRRVKDHRTDHQTSDVPGVMDGDIDDFIKAFLMEFGGENAY